MVLAPCGGGGAGSALLVRAEGAVGGRGGGWGQVQANLLLLPLGRSSRFFAIAPSSCLEVVEGRVAELVGERVVRL